MVDESRCKEYKVTNSGLDALLVSWQEGNIEPHFLSSLVGHIQSSLPWVLDVVVAETTLQCSYNPLQQLYNDAKRQIKAVIDGFECTTTSVDVVKKVRIPVCYHPSLAPDLERVIERCNVSMDELITLHSRAEYTVSMIGFAPGFGYLRGLPEQLHIPRLKSPRVSVPRGSVAIAEQYSAIYPQTSPGGWSLIGKTPIALFSVTQNPPCLLSVGAKVKFDVMDLQEYQELEKELISS